MGESNYHFMMNKVQNGNKIVKRTRKFWKICMF